MSFNIPMPACIINNQGKVINANEYIGEVFLYDGILDADIFTLTGVKCSELYEAAEQGISTFLKRPDKTFKMIPYKENPEEDADLTILFSDITSFEDLKQRYNSEKPCIAKILLDNYDQLFEAESTGYKMGLSSDIDQIIRRWAAKIDGSVSMLKSSKYMVWFEQQYLEKLSEDKFELLDEVRNLETGADFPASLSIGIGVGGSTMAETEEFADAAMDLALGRGGDQVVIKKKAKIEYYGGTLPTPEKSNKGKSRIVGHALKQLIEQSGKIFVMGHRYADMDSFGAALGVTRLCMMSEREPYIVLEDYNETLHAIYKQARTSEEYNFISCEKAVSLVDGDSLIVVVDTHRPSMVQCPQLLEKSDKVVVIDHHRKVEEFIENPMLAYMESYASSASELVSEILEYMGSKKPLAKIEAEALLAGITVDTNGFGVKTGVRTFEAAAWLRRQGADPTEVKRFFQEDFENIKVRAKAIAGARLYEEAGVVIATCPTLKKDAQLICAQVADRLLTIRGAKATFAIGRNGAEETVISARSLGDVNVQLIMEKFGGGGHLTTAAAQVKVSVEDTVDEIKRILEVK